jgi:hypothetical protein
MMRSLFRVLGEIAEERERQVTVHERTPEHDDKYTPQEWAWKLLQRVTSLSHPWPDAHADPRRELIEIAAIAVAAVEAIDRKAMPVIVRSPE